MAKVVPILCKPLHEHLPRKPKILGLSCQRKYCKRRIFPIERIHSRACTGISEQHKFRNEGNQPLWLKMRCCSKLGSPRDFRLFLLSLILTLYWLGLGVLSWSELL